MSSDRTLRGILPAEIWLMILHFLKADNSHRTMSCIAQCSSFFAALALPELYSKFSSGYGDDRSLALFFRTLVHSPDLANMVSSIDINGVGNPLDEDEDNIHMLLKVEERLRLLPPTTRELGGPYQTCTMLRILPCLLPKLKSIHLGLGIDFSDVGRFIYIQTWARWDSKNILPSLETLSLEYSVGNMGVRPSQVVGLFGGAAPNIRCLRLWPQFKESNLMLPSTLATPVYSQELDRMLENLRELHVVSNCMCVIQEGHLFQQCKKLELFTYLKRDDNSGKVVQEGDTTFPAQDYASYNVLTTPFMYIHPTFPLFKVGSRKTLKTMIVSAEFLIGIHVQDTYSNRRPLEELFPPSLRTLHVHDVDKVVFQTAFSSFPSWIAEGRYPNLKEVQFLVKLENTKYGLDKAQEDELRNVYANVGIVPTIIRV
ncbi:hypothetical protein GGR54DRAFT_308933 [Hypoxylon sp. NC1633]|nr:hypothetical protein GGR54DRAFT_308933 [Hypoxylon sp. NC1633]